MTGTVQTPGTSVNSHQSTRRYNAEGSHLHTHRSENFKSYFTIHFKTDYYIYSRNCSHFSSPTIPWTL
jgi:hypothetical protein